MRIYISVAAVFFNQRTGQIIPLRMMEFISVAFVYLYETLRVLYKCRAVYIRYMAFFIRFYIDFRVLLCYYVDKLRESTAGVSYAEKTEHQ